MVLGALKSLTLDGVGPSERIPIEFGNRLTVLTGDNGLGKSFLLDLGCWALTGSWAGHQAIPRDGASKPEIHFELNVNTIDPSAPREVSAVFDFFRQEWVEAAELILLDTIVLYARVDGSFLIWDPASVMLHHRRKYSALFLDNNAVWNGSHNNSKSNCNGLIDDWVKWQYRGGNTFDALEKVLICLSPPGELLKPGAPTRVALDDAREIPTIELPYGHVPVTIVSAGMRRILSLAYLIVWAWQEHSAKAELTRRSAANRLVFFIDEVESHLHPRWQRAIVPALLAVANKLTNDLSIQAIITTHAPLVLASLEDLFDSQQDKLFHLDLHDGRVMLRELGSRRHGDASAWLTSDVFGLKQPRSLPAEQAIEEAMAAMRQPNLTLQEIEAIHTKLRNVLKDTDPFWPRWLIRAKSAGMQV